MAIDNINRAEVNSWLFEHSNIQGHRCESVKGAIQGIEPGNSRAELVNVRWIDTVTKESIEVLWGQK